MPGRSLDVMREKRINRFKDVLEENAQNGLSVDKYIHVIPVRGSRLDTRRWNVFLDGSKRVLSKFDRKTSAIRYAQKVVSSGKASKVVVHNRNGEVSEIAKPA